MTARVGSFTEGASQITDGVPVNRNMGSISFFSQPDANTGTWVTPAEEFVDWLKRYNLYWIESSGITDGINLDWLYDRAVNLRGENVTEQMDELYVFGNGVAEVGLAFNLVLTIGDFLKLPRPIGETLREMKIGALTLMVSAEDAVRLDDDFHSAVEELTAASQVVTFVGDLRPLKASGILGTHFINQPQVTLIQRIPFEGEPELRTGTTRNCRSRIQFVVMMSGHIYPCFGLIGLEQCRLGHVTDDVAVLFERDKPALDLEQLIERGPPLPKNIEGRAEEGVPLDCHLHREMMERWAV